MRGTQSKILTLVFTIICILLVGVFVYSHAVPRTYHNQTIGLSLKYPGDFVLSELPTQEKAAIFNFLSPTSQIILVSFNQDHEYVDRDKVFYEGILFKDPNQKQNSHVSIGGYTGFRASITPEQARFALYKDISTASSSIIRAEINASSSQALISAESIFANIISSFSFK